MLPAELQDGSWGCGRGHLTPGAFSLLAWVSTAVLWPLHRQTQQMGKEEDSAQFPTHLTQVQWVTHQLGAPPSLRDSRLSAGTWGP